MSPIESQAAFAYEEPTIATILNQAGFLLALNIINVCLDKLLYCGLIGQLFMGILWGTPGAKWLSSDTERVIQQLGYLGLIMLVYEGGLSMSIKALKANIFISIAVALTGILVPIVLSFVLTELVSATYLQAFAAGAALSATSLGTTFTILTTTGLISTRLGTVTTSAAMLDDVVGLVMVQVITNLSGGSDTSFDPITIIRPVFVSIGFAFGVFLLCSLCLKPALRAVLIARDKLPDFMQTKQFAFLAHTALLFGMVAGATYAGTSSLFAAYLSGVIATWFDELAEESRRAKKKQKDIGAELGHLQSTTSQGPARSAEEPPSSEAQLKSDKLTSSEQLSLYQDSYTGGDIPKGNEIYEIYYKEPVNRILIPLFFASIGFAIPITEMFKGNIVWRGIVYALLMAIGKMVTGIWLVRFSRSSPTGGLMAFPKKFFSYITYMCTGLRGNPREKRATINSPKRGNQQKKKKVNEDSNQPTTANVGSGHDGAENMGSSSHDTPTNQVASSSSTAPPPPTESTPRSGSRISLPPKPKSLYPPSILGLAMIARGEIGYLIASLAQSQGIFSDGLDESSDIYLVIVWAISICTLIGPIAVGTLVRRVKTVQQNRGVTGGIDPLGVWGI